ncbi:MAG: NrfD/PsrC family molybdoenzyme membrane anchor subunit [Planctomycetota bacterium]|jgi:molybdopterin-containing oxidoreductase family membrane subunit
MTVAPDRYTTQLYRTVLSPIMWRRRSFVITVVFLSIVVAWGLFAYLMQLVWGLGVTGMNRPVYWGFYIVNFVFFIGISHAGTLISSILRISRVEWRRPFTRAAEALTIFSLPFGAMAVIVDLGRPERALNVIFHANFTSAILWDVCCIGTYMLTSAIYFYLALVPDIALCRDKLTRVPRWLHQVYRFLAAGWTGTERQWHRLERTLTVMSIFLFMLVISVHTNVSFVFGMTLQPGWHSTLISPYFVLGAIYSGIAAVVIVVAAFRKMFHLERYVTLAHFDSMRKFLIALCLFWFYFTFIEFLFTYYGHELPHMAVFDAKFFEEFSPVFWVMICCCFPVPLVLLCLKWTRSLAGLVVTCFIINAGMWLERFTVVIPSLTRPRLPYPQGAYTPTWVEWSVTAGFFAGMALLYVVFTKFFPILTLWELKEGRHEGLGAIKERLREYGQLPAKSEA